MAAVTGGASSFNLNLAEPDNMEFVIKNWYLFLGILVVLTMLLWPMMQLAGHGIRRLSAAEAVRLVNQENGVFIDVRESLEFDAGHIPKSVHAPLSGFGAEMAKLERFKSRPIVVCCRTSQRSARAAIQLRKGSFANVHVLAGGMTAWQSEHLPLEK